MTVDVYEEFAESLRNAQIQFELTVPKCHEHCDMCMSTGCSAQDHDADWREG